MFTTAQLLIKLFSSSDVLQALNQGNKYIEKWLEKMMAVEEIFAMSKANDVLIQTLDAERREKGL